ncbi:MAG TPA: R3H domain-containing nucleic acid-binding protein [Chloroflexota bacterium]|jgi:stage III sporulation protein SpoIIIAA|nr:R3H domain-containing nucleic acid-binding protein [Chloroflexota bacterium]
MLEPGEVARSGGDSYDEEQDIDALLAVLPPHILQAVRRSERMKELLEIVMDLGRQPEARFVNGEVVLSNRPVSFEDVEHVISRVGSFGEDNRAGIERTLHRISAIRNRSDHIIGLTLRVGRAVYGTIGIIQDIVESGQSILLLGRPGVGKTTMLREVARVLADDFKKRVVIVDTSNEIGGDGDIPHPAIGRSRRMQVQTPSRQHAVMIEAVENHMPEVIVIDEIGTELEAMAARTIAERGVQLVGTAHGNTLDNLMQNPTLSDLIGGIQPVTLGDEEARRRGTQKTVLERKAPPTFAVVIEISDWSNVTVHSNVADKVDAILREQPVRNEVRTRSNAGEIKIKQSNAQPVETTGAEWPEAVVHEGPSLRVYPFGVRRSQLEQAVSELRVPVEVVSRLDNADLMITLQTHYRKKARAVRDAESAGVPVEVLRSNTIVQLRNLLARIFDVGYPERDSEIVAMEEAEDAVSQVLNHSRIVSLTPRNAHVRRQQHAIAERYNVSSSSRGTEPNRRVVFFPRPERGRR